MSDQQFSRSFSKLGRRSFVGGLTSLLAASAFSLEVSTATAAQVTNGNNSPTQTVRSPDGSVTVTVDLSDHIPSYQVTHDGETVVDDSTLGFKFQNQPPFQTGITVTGSERSTTNTSWTPIWDQYDEIEEHYNELRLGLQETASPNRTLTFEVRAFNDGIGFRYVFPTESGFREFVITSEETEFAFSDDYTSWWIQNDPNSYEYTYNKTPLSEIGSKSPFGGAHTPLTMQAADDRYLSLHEASLLDYAAMSVEPVSDGSTTLESTLAPLPDGTKVTATAPHQTPWRTIQLGKQPGDLVESNLIVNLNEPLDEAAFPKGTDWIEPQKFMGIWWLMITGRAQWEYQGPQTGNHGAQTGRMKRYMDFASEHGIPSVLAEGWNEGWSTYPGDGSAMDFDDPYPDFDWDEITDYGQQLDPPVAMTAHNETAGDIINYENQLTSDPSIFADYEDHQIHSVKNGYVADNGVTINGTTYNHHCQRLVNHHHLVVTEAAKHRQMIEGHEPVKPTGKRRTYPNIMTHEGVKGQEYDSFGYVDPKHHVTLPFTRMLAGPFEYTPGIFDMDSGSGGIETTRAKQLAMYPTYFSGLQMVADLPSSYLADQGSTLNVGAVAQAEFGNRNGFSTAAKWANAQGGQYIPVDPNRSDSDATVSWTVEGIEQAGQYELHLRYASDKEQNAVSGDTPRTATVTVGESTKTQLTFPPTKYWDDWETISTPISLANGDTTISLTMTDADTGGFNLDAIAVTAAGEPMPTPATEPTLGPTVDEFKFIEDVPAAGWDNTRVLGAEIGDYSITARQKDEDWYVGAMTDETGRALDISLDFLETAPGTRTGHKTGHGNGHGQSTSPDRSPSTASDCDSAPGTQRNGDTDHGHGRGQGHTKGKYVAEIYSDGIDAAYPTNLSDVRVDKAIVDSNTTVLASVVGSGGQAIRLTPATRDNLEQLSVYERPEQEYESIDVPENASTTKPFTITITGSHSGDYIGGEELNVYADGEQIDTALVRFASDTETDRIDVTITDAGTYDITVGRSLDDALPSQTISVQDPYARDLPSKYSTFSSTPTDFGRIGETLLINASGKDVENYADQYGTIYVDNGLGTTGTVTTTITDQEQTNTYAKGGLMVKNDLTQAGESTGYVLLATAPGLGPFMHADLDGDGFVDTFYGSDVPYTFPTHLRLEKDGTTFTGSVSVDDGSTYTEVTSFEVSSAAPTQDAGMFVTSHNTGTKSQVSFSNFSIDR